MRQVQSALLTEGREDRAALFEYDEGLVAVVADGAGGTGGGAEAAQGVIEAVRHLGWQPDAMAWTELLARLDPRLAPGQTTAVIVALGATWLFGASVGDSEARWWEGPAEHALTRNQHRKPLLGSGEAVPVGFTREARGEGQLVLGSDGLWKYVRAESLAAALLLPPGPAAALLVKSVRYPSGRLPDDIAVIVCHAGKGGSR